MSIDKVRGTSTQLAQRAYQFVHTRPIRGEHTNSSTQDQFAHTRTIRAHKNNSRTAQQLAQSISNSRTPEQLAHAHSSHSRINIRILARQLQHPKAPTALTRVTQARAGPLPRLSSSEKTYRGGGQLVFLQRWQLRVLDLQAHSHTYVACKRTRTHTHILDSQAHQLNEQAGAG